MTLQVIRADDAESLFGVVRDTDFGWTVADLPALLATLGWTVRTEIEGKGAVVATPWGVAGADADLLYDGDTVLSITVRLTGPSDEGTADQLALVDAFASLTALVTGVLGPPTATFRTSVPRTQWRLAKATCTLQDTGASVLLDWCSNEYQDFNDSVGRY